MAQVGPKDYEALLAERPRKFTAAQVGFIPQTDEYPCAGCLHYYHGMQAETAVCEIFRPKGPDERVPPEGSCKFWTIDGRHFPKLETED